jgi:hypothetical protein
MNGGNIVEAISGNLQLNIGCLLMGHMLQVKIRSKLMEF